MTVEDLQVGMAVRFHPIVGGKHDGRVYTVLSVGERFGRPIAHLKGKPGCALVAALSPVQPGYLIDAPEHKPATEDPKK